MRLLRRRWARFTVVGASNALISYVVLGIALVLLAGVGLGVWLAQAVSYAVGVLWSFFWNRRWTFHAVGGGRQLLPFVLLQVGLLLTTASAFDRLLASTLWPTTVAWLAVMVPATIANFLAQRFWVFGGRS